MNGAVEDGPSDETSERPTSDRMSAYGAPWLMYRWGRERVFRVDALPPGPRPISYKVISADGASWANRRADAHPDTPPPTMATRHIEDVIFAVAVPDTEVIAVVDGIQYDKQIARTSTANTILSTD